MPRNDPASLCNSLIAAGNLSARVIGAGTSARWDELAAGAVFNTQVFDLRGRTVVLAMIDQLAAAAALIQLDGVARRMVLCPPDLSREHILFAAGNARADLILTDRPELETELGRIDSRAKCIVAAPREFAFGQFFSGQPVPGDLVRSPQVETEWILLTSGTTGIPKLVVHTLASLTEAARQNASPSSAIVWSTFYDLRRYGGLQIFLRAALTGTSLVLSSAQESTSDFLARAGAQGVTHISGTPSHWRRALMSTSATSIAPEYVRLSGEIADQAILNQLRVRYPQARIAHAFATTEAGVAFEVNDGLMGVPADVIGHSIRVDLKVEDGTLRVRSGRTAACYLGESQTLKDVEGFVDTGDVLKLREGRYYFAGRRDGIINVGGLKVHPEEVEAVINRHPEVGMSLVSPKRNPITGAIVIADVVLKTGSTPVNEGAQTLQQDILQFCRRELAAHKIPVAINFVPALAVAETGKLIRRHA
jgi:acyl-coenzyme A synthetase/AMP-(fatty) acid ligase